MELNRAFLFAFFGLTLLAAACTSSTPNNTNVNQAAVANTNTVASTNTTAPTPLSSPTAANVATGSPSATVAAYHQAMVKKDEAAFRKVLSQPTLREFAAFAREEEAKSLIEYWTGFSSPAARLQIRNEQIAGDAAYVDIGNDEGAFIKHKLVRENGEWKLDLTEATFRQLR